MLYSIYIIYQYEMTCHFYYILSYYTVIIFSCIMLQCITVNYSSSYDFHMAKNTIIMNIQTKQSASSVQCIPNRQICQFLTKLCQRLIIIVTRNICFVKERLRGMKEFNAFCSFHIPLIHFSVYRTIVLKSKDHINKT
jgi:hypothetical protein